MRVLASMRLNPDARVTRSIGSISSRTLYSRDVNSILKSVKDEVPRLRGFLVGTTWGYLCFRSRIAICCMRPCWNIGLCMKCEKSLDVTSLVVFSFSAMSYEDGTEVEQRFGCQSAEANFLVLGLGAYSGTERSGPV